MKKVLLTIHIALLAHSAALACTVCGKQQPKLMRGIAHGAGPESEWDYVIVGVITFMVILSLVYAVKWIVKPGEQQHEHIKRSNFIIEHHD